MVTARTIARRPAVLFCNEPTGGLDIATGVLVFKAIDRVNRESGTAVAVVPHRVAIAGKAERVLRLVNGKVVEVTASTSGRTPAELRR
jgi:putative ABC transport system ATP-binding protein